MDVRYVDSFPGIDLNHSILNSHLPKKFLVTSVGLKKNIAPLLPDTSEKYPLVVCSVFTGL